MTGKKSVLLIAAWLQINVLCTGFAVCSLHTAQIGFPFACKPLLKISLLIQRFLAECSCQQLRVLGFMVLAFDYTSFTTLAEAAAFGAWPNFVGWRAELRESSVARHEGAVCLR